jgi:hypothetical protein
MYKRVYVWIFCERERARAGARERERKRKRKSMYSIYIYIGSVSTRQCDGLGPASSVHELTAAHELATATSPYTIGPCAPREGYTTPPSSTTLQTPRGGGWRRWLSARGQVRGRAGVFFWTKQWQKVLFQKRFWYLCPCLFSKSTLLYISIHIYIIYIAIHIYIIYTSVDSAVPYVYIYVYLFIYSFM